MPRMVLMPATSYLFRHYQTQITRNLRDQFAHCKIDGQRQSERRRTAAKISLTHKRLRRRQRAHRLRVAHNPDPGPNPLIDLDICCQRLAIVQPLPPRPSTPRQDEEPRRTSPGKREVYSTKATGNLACRTDPDQYPMGTSHLARTPYLGAGCSMAGK